jgi:polyhydroxyalkanoate synthase
MSEQDEQANHVAPSGPPLVDFWTSGFQQAAEHAQRSLGIAGGGGVDPRLWRRQWLDTLAHAADAYLRSPMFLLMLRTHVDSLVQAKLASDSERSDPPSSSRQMADDIQAMRSRLDQLQQQLDLVDETLRGTSDPEILARPENEAEPSAGQERVASKPSSPAARERGTGATPYDVVYQEGLLKLLRYRGDSVRFAEPILVCFALVNRPYILDLKTDRSVVRRLLDRGFDVYLIDWGIPDEASSQLRLDDYVCKFLDNVVSFVCDSVGTPQLNLLGYCMGGTMSTMFTALQPDRVRNLILMATPIDFAGDEGLLNLWAREEYFDVDKLIDAFGNCPGEFLKFVFQLMKPVQNFAEKQLTLSENLSDATFVDNFVAVERWAADSIPVVGETFRQYVKSLYQQNQLVKGQLRLAGKPVRLEAIDCPLLLLVAEKDHLVTPESTLALKQHVRSKESQSISIDAGHVGLAVSSRAHRRLWPEAANWIANHSTEL